MATDSKPEAIDSKSGAPDLIQMALDNPSVPKIYLNGFQIGSTNADVMILAQQNIRPVAVINMSFELAKTLVSKLGYVMKRIEDETDTKFLTTDDFKKDS